MDIKELRQLSEDELRKDLQSLKEKLRGFRFKTARRELKSVRDVRVVKQTIARISTILQAAKSLRK